MRTERVLQAETPPCTAPGSAAIPCASGPAATPDVERQRAALRLRRLSERQRATGDPAGLNTPPAAILALFQ